MSMVVVGFVLWTMFAFITSVQSLLSTEAAMVSCNTVVIQEQLGRQDLVLVIPDAILLLYWPKVQPSPSPSTTYRYATSIIQPEEHRTFQLRGDHPLVLSLPVLLLVVPEAVHHGGGCDWCGDDQSVGCRAHLCSCTNRGQGPQGTQVGICRGMIWSRDSSHLSQY